MILLPQLALSTAYSCFEALDLCTLAKQLMQEISTTLSTMRNAALVVS